MKALGIALVLLACGESQAQAMRQRAQFRNCGFVDPRMCGRAAIPAPPPLFQFQPSTPGSAAQCTGAALTGTAGQTITFTRATVATCKKGDTTIVGLTSGQPGLESDGLRLEPAATNKVDTSEDLSGGSWNLTGTTLSVNSTLAPDGTMTADTMLDDNTNGLHRAYQGIPSDGSANYTFSVYAKAGTYHFLKVLGSQTAIDAVFDLSNGTYSGQGNATYYGIEPAGNGFYRMWVGKNDSAPGFYQLFMGDTALHARNGYAGSTAGTVIIWGAHVESLGSTVYPSSYIKTTGTAVTRNLAKASFPNPLKDADASWCVRVKATPNWTIWTKGNVSGLFMIGTTQAAADTADAWVGTDGKVLFHVYDHAGSGSVKTFTATNALSDGQHDLRFCDTAGTLTAFDGISSLAGAVTGAGTGQITTQPATVYMGSTNATNILMGRILDVCIINTSTGCVSGALSQLSLPSAGAGLLASNFMPREPEWCVRGAFAANAEIAGAGTLAAANSWTFAGSGGALVSTVVDFTGASRTRTGTATFSGTHTARVCNKRGEQFLFLDDVPQLATLTDSTGIGLIDVQPANIRADATACVSRDWSVCGSAPKEVAVLGDSLATAPGTTTPWPIQLDGLLPSTWDVRNYAVGGTTFAQMLASQWSLGKQSHAWRYVVVFGGINDIAGGATGANAYADLLTLMQDIEGTGATVILITPTPWKHDTLTTWSSGKQTEFNALITAMKASGRLYYDANPVFEDPNEQYALLSTYNIALADGVHLSNSAQPIVAAGVYAQMTL